MRTKARKYGKAIPTQGRYGVSGYPHRFESRLEASIFAGSLRKRFNKEIQKILRKAEARRGRRQKEAGHLLKRIF